MLDNKGLSTLLDYHGLFQLHFWKMYHKVVFAGRVPLALLLEMNIRN